MREKLEAIREIILFLLIVVYCIYLLMQLSVCRHTIFPKSFYYYDLITGILWAIFATVSSSYWGNTEDKGEKEE